MSKLVKSGVIVFLGIIIGRLAGFFRESVFAHKFGTTENADIAVLILTIPDLITNILVGGAMGAVLIPEFKQMKEKSMQLFIQSILFIGLVFTLIILFFILNSFWLINILAPGLEFFNKEKTSLLINISLWTIPLTAMTAVVSAFLNSKDKFAMVAFGTLIFNGIIIIILTMPFGRNDLTVLAYATIIGALVRLFLQVGSIKHTNISFNKIFSNIILDKCLITRYFQSLFAGGFLFLIPVVARIFSSYEKDGSIAIYNYSSKLLELPLGAFITVIPVILLPKLSEFFVNKDTELAGIKLAKQGLNIIFLLAVIITLYLSLFNTEVVKLLFGWGVMSSNSILQIALLTSIGALSLPAQGMTSLIQTIFSAKRDTKTPFYISIVSIMIFFPLVWLFQYYLALTGLMISIVIIYWFIFVVHIIALNNKHKINLLKTIFNKINLTNLILVGSFFIPLTVIIRITDFPSIINLLIGLFSVILTCIAIVLKEKYRNSFIQKLIWERGA